MTSPKHARHASPESRSGNAGHRRFGRGLEETIRGWTLAFGLWLAVLMLGGTSDRTLIGAGTIPIHALNTATWPSLRTSTRCR